MQDVLHISFSVTGTLSQDYVVVGSSGPSADVAPVTDGTQGGQGWRAGDRAARFCALGDDVITVRLVVASGGHSGYSSRHRIVVPPPGRRASAPSSRSGAARRRWTRARGPLPDRLEWRRRRREHDVRVHPGPGGGRGVATTSSDAATLGTGPSPWTLRVVIPSTVVLRRKPRISFARSRMR